MNVPMNGISSRWGGLCFLLTANFVVMLDITIMHVALIPIQRELVASQDELIWAINCYSFSFAAVLLLWGAVGDRFGRRRMIVAGLAIFGLGSVGCALAESPAQLIGFRAVMGVGAASVSPLSLALLTVTFPPRDRGKAVGLWTATLGGAVAFGPLVGGLLLERPEVSQWLAGNPWGIVFLVNVPLVAVSILGIRLLLPESIASSPRPLGLMHQTLAVIGTLALAWALHGAAVEGWGAPTTLIPLAVGVALLGAFGWTQKVSRKPLLDVSALSRRRYSVPLATVSLAFAAMQGALPFLVIYYQVVRGWSPLHAGLLVLPFAVTQVLGAAASGCLVRRFGGRAVMSAGLALSSAGMACFALARPDSGVALLVVASILLGGGLGAGQAAGTTMLTLAASIERSGMTSALLSACRHLSAALTLALLSSVVTLVFRDRLAVSIQAIPGLDSGRLGELSYLTVGGILNGTPGETHSGSAALDRLAADAFLSGMHVAVLIATGFLVGALVLVRAFLPHDSTSVHEELPRRGPVHGPREPSSVQARDTAPLPTDSDSP